MDVVKDQLVKDVAGLVKDVAELKQFQITEGRVREIVKAELVAAAPPPETKRLFKSSQKKKSQA